MRTTLKNVLSGKVVDKTFNAGVKVETATVDKRDMTFLYKDGGDFVFMDGDTYDQIHISGADRRRRGQLPAGEPGGDGRRRTRASCSTSSCPASVELVVSHTDPGLQGDRSTGGTKPATLETGAEINVPLFLNTGDKIKVDTRDGRYLGRVTEPWRVTDGRPHKARKRALDVLYAAEARGVDPLAVLAERADGPPTSRSPEHYA